MATYQLSYGFKPDGTKDENPLKFDDDEEEEMEVDEPKEKVSKKEQSEKKKPGENLIYFILPLHFMNKFILR